MPNWVKSNYFNICPSHWHMNKTFLRSPNVMYFVSHIQKCTFLPCSWLHNLFSLCIHINPRVFVKINDPLAELWTVYMYVSLISPLVRAAQSGVWWGAGWVQEWGVDSADYGQSQDHQRGQGNNHWRKNMWMISGQGDTKLCILGCLFIHLNNSKKQQQQQQQPLYWHYPTDPRLIQKRKKGGKKKHSNMKKRGIITM